MSQSSLSSQIRKLRLVHPRGSLDTGILSVVDRTAQRLQMNGVPAEVVLGAFFRTRPVWCSLTKRPEYVPIQDAWVAGAIDGDKMNFEPELDELEGKTALLVSAYRAVPKRQLSLGPLVGVKPQADGILQVVSEGQFTSPNWCVVPTSSDLANNSRASHDLAVAGPLCEKVNAMREFVAPDVVLEGVAALALRYNL